MKHFYFISLLMFVLTACKQNQKSVQEPLMIADTIFAGNYVTPDYHQRNLGYDWVAVKVSGINDSLLQISIRSRADKKKPTCTFDAIASKTADSKIFDAIVEGFHVFFSFNADSLVISGETDQDNLMLGYFCSGGASIAGIYHKINEPLDTMQIDKVLFRKGLNFDKFFFEVEVYDKILTLKSYGLEDEKAEFKHNIEGNTVVNAEIGDLNNDNFPEVLIYLQSVGSGSYGTVIGYSVIKGKSLNPLVIPDIFQDKEIKEGYMGHDEFAIVEGTFNQRFPVYNQGDSNANPTGGIRQIEFKMTGDDSHPDLVVDKIVEY